MIKRIKVTEYLQPKYYSCMSKEMFAKLNKAFGEGLMEVDVDVSDFNTMMLNYKEKMHYVKDN